MTTRFRNTDNSLLAARKLGQQVWLDNLSRELLRDGRLERLVKEDGIDGVTSNPSIFQKAIGGSPYYREDLARLKKTALTAEERYESLAIPDIREACDLLQQTFSESAGEAGYVSLEVSPALAHDEPGTLAAARRLRKAVDRANVLIKVPATAAGVRAFENLTAEGINVNVTLIFSPRQYEAVARAYLRGARRCVAAGGMANRLRSVASVFLSRVDSLVDKRLTAVGTAEAMALRGHSGVALARVCYLRYGELFGGTGYADLAAAGVRPQAPLWASTGTKDPAYSDVLYVEPLIGAGTINTMPDATLAAFRDHGRAAAMPAAGGADAQAHVRRLADLGIGFDEVGETLQAEGVALFADAFAKLLAEML